MIYMPPQAPHTPHDDPDLTTARCKRTCRGGNRCCLRSDVKHNLHICRKPECQCHDLRQRP